MKKLFLTLGIAVASYSSSFAQWQNGTNIHNTNSGNVGIGTAGPAAKLDIWPAGTGAVLRGNSGGSIIVPAFELNGYNTSVSNAGLTISTNDGGAFSEKMRVSSNGDVGIGTTNPAVKLDVHGSTYSANFQNTAASNSPVVSISQTNAGGNDAAQGLYIDARSTGSALDIYNSSTPLFRVKNNGSIGIGTANPLALLSVNVPSVTAGTRNPLLVGEVGNSVITNAIYNTVESATPFGWGLAFDTYKVNTGQIEAMRINNAGNVGIGTTSPSSLLDVVSSVNSSWATQILNNGSTNAHGLYVNIGSGSTGIPFRVDVNGAGKLQVSNNGNVLIGKTSQTNPAYKLDINGSARANEIVVNTDGADFVFEPDYNLPKLSDVKKFINQNHHLPQIPSAAEMQKKGMNVGELNTKLLQKVEELTLYLIEENRKNKDQEVQINQLKEQLTSLTKAITKN